MCWPCRSALKRARDTTVSEGLPLSRRPRKLPLLRPPEPLEPIPPPVTANPRGGPRLSWAVGAALVVVAGIVWFIQSHDPGSAVAANTAELAAGAEDDGSETAGAKGAEALPAPELATPTEPAPPPEREPINLHKLPSTITLPKVAPKPPPPVAPDPAPPVVIAPPAPPPAPAPVVVAQAPPPKAVPDRWQLLSQRLAACPQGLFERVYCQETLRLEYCEGYWGRVPPCPAKVERDYGN